ncbi:MAG: hypothetical protein ACR2JC_10285, partial [Chloroflexota bacterium]
SPPPPPRGFPPLPPPRHWEHVRPPAPTTHRFLVTGPAEAFAERAQAMFRASPLIETVDVVSGLSYARLG